MRVILKETLKQSGMSMYRLSAMTGISASTLCNLCGNKTKQVDFATLDRICMSLNCSVSDILCHDNDAKLRKEDACDETSEIRE